MGNLFPLYIFHIKIQKMGFFRLVGILLVSASLLYFGWNLYTDETLKADTNRRLSTLWNEAASKYPALAQHNAAFSANSHYIILFLTYALLGAPVIVFCRYCTIFVIPAYALWVAMFYNP